MEQSARTQHSFGKVDCYSGMDLHNTLIKYVSDPEDPQDAVNKRSLQAFGDNPVFTTINAGDATINNLTVSGTFLALPQIAIIEDQKSIGTNGGTSTTGYNTRTLNTIVSNGITGLTLNSNQISLPAGTYGVRAYVPAYSAGQNRCRLYNVSTSTTLLLGTSEIADNNNASNSHMDGVITLSATNTLRVDHYCSSVHASQGYGHASNSGDVEVYTRIVLTKYL